MKRPAALLLLLLPGLSIEAAPAEPKVYASHLMVDQEVSVSSRITGVVETIHVERGAAVTRGQPLATLELREFDQDVEQAKQDMELKKVELERAKAMSAGGVSSQSDLDVKRAQYAVAVAAWEKARVIRDYAVIRAPFAGVVTEKSARVGQKVVDVQNIPLFKVTATLLKPAEISASGSTMESRSCGRARPAAMLVRSGPMLPPRPWMR